MECLESLEQVIESGELARELVLQKICKTAAEIVPRANLVSLWVFEQDGQQIRSLINYSVEEDSYSSGYVLEQKDYPLYFKAIVENELIVANDARNHRVTRGFNRSYFIPLDIYSLLDFILHNDFTPYGIICLESKGQAVSWTLEDQEHIRMLATIISYCFDLGAAD